MTAGLLNDEALFLGAAFAHIRAYRERQRLDRIAASSREAMRANLARRSRLSHGEWGFAPVIACDGGVGA